MFVKEDVLDEVINALKEKIKIDNNGWSKIKTDCKNFEVVHCFYAKNNKKVVKNQLSKERIFKIAFSFLGHWPDWVEFLLSSKKNYETFLPVFYSMYLKKTPIINKNRFQMWKILCEKNYKENKTPIDNLTIISDIDPPILSIVECDVARSFKLDKDFNKDALYELIRAGTIRMKNSASYCQGMNYIAGMLLYQEMSKEEALNLYILIIEGRMKAFFNHNLSDLQKYFFVLDNLINVYLKELSIDFAVI